MKARESLMAALLIGLTWIYPAAAANRTTQLGEIDPDSHAFYLRLLGASSGGVATEALRLSSRAEARMRAAIPVTAELRPQDRTAAATSGADVWLMLIVGAGLVAFHLRRNQKSLLHRPLSDLLHS